MDDDDFIENDRHLDAKVAQKIKEFLSKKVNAQNAFETPTLDKFRDEIQVQPLQCVGAMIEAHAKVYGYRVDNTHSECVNVLKRTNEEGSKNTKKRNLGDALDANENDLQNGENPDDAGNGDDDEQPGTSKDADANARKGKKNRVNHLQLFEKSGRTSDCNNQAYRLANSFTKILDLDSDREIVQEEILNDLNDFNSKMQEIIASRRVGVPFIAEKTSTLNREDMDYGIEESMYKKVAKQFSEGCSQSFVSNQIETNQDGTFMVLHTNWPNEEPKKSKVKPVNGAITNVTASHEAELAQIELALNRASIEHPCDLPFLQQCCEDEAIEVQEEQPKQPVDCAASIATDEFADLEDISSIGAESRLSVERQSTVEVVKQHRKELFEELGFTGDLIPQNGVVEQSIPLKPVNYLMSRFAPLFDSIWHSVLKKIPENELTQLGGTVGMSVLNTPYSLGRTPLGKSLTIRTPSPAISPRNKPGWKAESPFVTPVLSRVKGNKANPQFATPNNVREDFIYFWARPRQYPMVYPGQQIDESPMSNGEELAAENGIALEDIQLKECVAENNQLDQTLTDKDQTVTDEKGADPAAEILTQTTIDDNTFIEPMQLNNTDNYMPFNDTVLTNGIHETAVEDHAAIDIEDNADEVPDDAAVVSADEENNGAADNEENLDAADGQEETLLDVNLLPPVVELQEPVVEPQPVVEDNSHWKGDPALRSDSPASSSNTGQRQPRKRNADRNFATTKRKRPIAGGGSIEKSTDDMFWLPASMALKTRLNSIRKGQLKTATERITYRDKRHLAMPDNPRPAEGSSMEYDPLNLIGARLFQKGKFGFWSYAPSHEPNRVEPRFISRPQQLSERLPTIEEQFDDFQRIYFSLAEAPRVDNLAQQNFDDPNEHFVVEDCDPELANELAAANGGGSPVAGPSGLCGQAAQRASTSLRDQIAAEDQDDEELELLGGAYLWNDPTNGRFNDLLAGGTVDDDELFELIGEMIRLRHYLRKPQFEFLRKLNCLRPDLQDYLDVFFSDPESQT